MAPRKHAKLPCGLVNKPFLIPNSDLLNTGRAERQPVGLVAAAQRPLSGSSGRPGSPTLSSRFLPSPDAFNTEHLDRHLLLVFRVPGRDEMGTDAQGQGVQAVGASQGRLVQWGRRSAGHLRQ